ncbi:T9SS type A sorting domain-containing protein [Kaistella sp. DKR-2]|uniref:GEVED domain-containing protein n=1 Tax=Kaistella soli TaxID=2849654 RepID=UPI001C27ECB6|nr:GEVED domain-containing protein [Kaistella soli]MBU8882738.1 T9SS type A sorting domain-containing protein [Kaistella soli]
MKKFSQSIKVLLVVLFVVLGAILKAQSNHTVTFTGNAADFNVGEKFSAAAGNTDYYITFDATYMYFGAFRTSGTFGANDNLAIYIDADPRNAPTTAGNGSVSGKAYNGVTASLPFKADYSSYTEQGVTDPLNKFNGSWASTGVIPTVFTGTTVREVRIALADLGNPASVYVTMWMGYAGGLYSNAPGTDVAASATPTIAGYFGSFPVYKSGVNPVTFRTQNTSAATGGGTAISNLTISSTGTIAAGDYGDVTILGAAAVIGTLGGNTSITGTLSVGTGFANRLNLGSKTLFVGGRGIGGSAGQLSINGTSGTPIDTSSNGTISFLGNGLVLGTASNATVDIIPSGTTFITTGALDLGAVGGATRKSGIYGTLQINSGGSIITNAPNYQAGSTLIYNTGGSYGAGLEWTTASPSTQGVPFAVTLQGNTAVHFGSSSAYRQANGLVTINSGSSLTLSSLAGGDLRIGGGAGTGLTNSGTFNTNGRALWWVGTGAGIYTKTGGGTENLDVFIHNSTATLNLAASPNATNWNMLSSGITTASAVQMQSSGALNLDANTLTIPNNGTIYVTGGSSTISGNSPATPGIINFAGVGSVTPVTTGTSTITTTANTRVQTGSQLIIGGTAATPALSVAGVFRLNQGGSVDNAAQPIKYNAGSTLEYNQTSGTYGVQATEWPATNGPTNVTLINNGGAGVNFGNNNITARTIAGTLTLGLNQSLSLTGSGTPNLTVLNTTAAANSLVSGSGNYTQSATGTFTTANTGGVDGTVTTSGTKTFVATNNFTFNNAIASQVAGSLMPTTINNLVINNPTIGTGTTLSSNTLLINGTTTLTAGALVLPTAAGNLVTFTGAIGGTTGTLTGSSTSNISTNSLSGTFNLGFTVGGQALNNWTLGLNAFGSSATNGLATPVSISGTFTQPTINSDFYSTSTGAMTILSGATYDEQANAWYRGAGSLNINSGATFKINAPSGLFATSATGAVQTIGFRTFSGGANYTFNNSGAQSIGDALDVNTTTGKTGPITGTVNITGGVGQTLTLNTGTTMTINSPGSFNMGILNTSGTTVTAPATSIINGSGNVNMFGNGALNGATLVTANPGGVNGTFAGTGTFNLSNGTNNNTNFTFNGAVAQTTGNLLPATVNNLSFPNTFSGSVATPSVILSSSVTANGTTTFAGGAAPLGLVGIGANTLTINGPIVFTSGSKLVGTASSNLIIGGSGAIPATSLFATSGGTLNDFTMNRTTNTVTVGQPLTVGGTYNSTAGVTAMGGNGLTLNGPINFGAGTLTSTGPLSVGGTGAITGSLLSPTNPLALTGITMNRTGATFPLGQNVTVSNATGVTLTDGNIALGNFNLTNTNSAGTLGTGASNSMIVSNGTGRAFLSFATGASTKTYPVGDGINFSPTTLTFSANAVAGIVGVNVLPSAHPSLNVGGTQTDYLNRYWSFTTSGITNYTYQASFTYVPSDIVGTEANINANRWDGSSWSEIAGGTIGSNTLTTAAGLTNVTAPLLATSDYTGRVNVTPTIVLSSNAFAAGNITQNTTLNPVYSFAVDTSVANALLKGLKITTSGTYSAANLTNLKLYYQTTSTFNSGTATLVSTLSAPGAAGLKTFPAFSQTITVGTKGYFFVTADVSCMVIGNTIAVNAVAASDLTFASGIPTGSSAAGNTQTFAATTPVNATALAASVANASSVLTWTAPTSCYSEIMIIAASAANTGTPTGDGTTYTANLAYGNGTSLGNGFVVYKGSTSPETVTALANGTGYYYKIFTRNGTVWSSGLEIGPIAPAVTYCVPTYSSGTSFGDYISNVTVVGTTLNNTSVGAASSPYYTLYPQSGSTTATLNTGGNYTLSIKNGSFKSYIATWIDYNGNGIFETSEYLGVITAAATTAGTLTFNVPNVGSGAVLGTARMRVRYSDTSPGPLSSESCGATNSTYGETEDYAITIAAAVPPNITSLGSSSGCVGTSITINGTGLTGVTAANVKIGGTPVASITSNSGTVLVAVIGAGTTGTVSVTTAGGTATSAATFTVNPLPVVTWANSTAAVCQDATATTTTLAYTSTTNSPTTYSIMWNSVPANSFAAITDQVNTFASGAGTITINVPAGASSGTYTGTISVKNANGCVSAGTQTFTLTVNPAPLVPAITETLFSASGGTTSCDLDYVKLDVGSVAPVILTSEKFESATYNVSFSASPLTNSNFFVSSTLYSEGSKSIRLNYSGSAIGYMDMDITKSIDLTNASAATLTFDHIAALEGGIYDYGNLYYSINGTDFYLMPMSFYSGSGSTDPSYIQFDKNSYTAWNSFTSISTPTNTMWKSETINLSSLIGNSQVYIGFEMSHDGSVNYNGWSIDNIKLNATPKVTWSPTTNLYTDATLSTLIGSGNYTTVFASPETAQTYTATATLGTCTKTASSASIVTDKKTFTGSVNNNWSVAGNWLRGSVPTIAKCVNIPSGKTAVVDIPNAVAKNVTVAAGGKLTINAKQSLTVKETFTNNAGVSDVMIESDGNLIQKDEIPAVANSGAISAKRVVTIKDNTQYNYLISPLIGMFLKNNIYENAGTFSNAPITLYHNEGNNMFYSSTGAYIEGRGLAVKEPAAGSGTVNVYFKGVPKNGSFTYNLANSNLGASTLLGYNLTGNPYPSNISLIELYKIGSNATNLSSTFYFWDNTANAAGTAQAGSGYNGAAYAIFNVESGSSGTGKGAGYLSGGTQALKVPDGIVKTGQGFMVKSIEKVNKTLTFNNGIRVGDGGVAFFGNVTKNSATVTDDRFWLNLTAPSAITNDVAVVYFENGNNSFTKDDSELNGLPSDILYTLIGDRKAVINGRAPFVNTDKIPLGSNFFATGNYTFSLGSQEGVFANGQSIYLKDKQTGIITNLSAGAYSFSAAAGESTGRFEIIYQPEAVLATDAAVKEEVQVYRDGNDFVVKARSKKITDLEVYDAAGRLIEQMQPKSLKVIIPSEIIINGTYLLKITQGGATVVKKILK